MVAQQQRQTAYKVWISDLLNNEYVIQQGEWEPNYIGVNGRKVSRVNIVATVIDRQDTDLVSSITLDDGTGSITTRCFNENTKILRDIKIGDLVMVVGRPRENNNQRFIVTEIAKRLSNPLWTQVRKLELEKQGAIPKKEGFIKEAVVNQTDTKEVDDSRKTMLKLIRSVDDGNGANVDEVIKKSGIDEEEVRKIIRGLLEQGEIYENRPNRLKTIE